jgi:hypothetical protein
MARPSVAQFRDTGTDILFFSQKLQGSSVKITVKRQALCIRTEHRKTQQ